MEKNQAIAANFRLTGLLIQEAGSSFIDQADILEQEGILEQVYTFLSNGMPLGRPAQALGVSVDRMKNILKSSDPRRRKYAAARASALADDSFDVLGLFKGSDFMVKEEAAAARHHMSVIKLAVESASKDVEQDTGPKIVMNTQINYGSGMEKPELPEELQNVLEHE